MGLRTLGLVGLASCVPVQAIVHSGLTPAEADRKNVEREP